MDRGELRVGEAAARAGVGVQTLHYYERRGLIARPLRTGAGYRVYDAPTVRRVRAIKRAQGLGFTLGEISELIELAEAGPDPRQVARAAERKLAVIEARIADLERVRGALLEALETCRCGGDPGRCDALKGLGAEPETEEEVA